MPAGGEKFAEAFGGVRHGVRRGDADDIEAGATTIGEEGGFVFGGSGGIARRIANGAGRLSPEGRGRSALASVSEPRRTG